MMSAAAARDDWLRLDDAALLAQCDVETRRVGGPGGQKRNKTSSAIRLRHRPSGVTVVAGESRSQSENKVRAVRRLKQLIALSCRVPVGPDAVTSAVVRKHLTPDGALLVSERHPEGPLLTAILLDAIDAHGGRLALAAAALGLTTSQLSRYITRRPKVLAVVNAIRHRAALRPLSTPS